MGVPLDVPSRCKAAKVIFFSEDDQMRSRFRKGRCYSRHRGNATMKCPHCQVDPYEAVENTKDYMISILQNVNVEEFGREFIGDLSCPRCGHLTGYCPCKFN